MPHYNKNIFLYEEGKLPSIYKVDTFDHLPPCPSRVLEPLRMIIPESFDPNDRTPIPHGYTTDEDAINWFLTIVKAACDGVGTPPFNLQDFIQPTAEGPECLVLRALPRYRDEWLKACPDISTDRLVTLCLVLYNISHNHLVDEKKASDEACVLSALTSEFIEHFHRSVVNANIYKKYSDISDNYDELPLQLRFKYDWSYQVYRIVAGRFLDSGKCLYTFSRIMDLLGVETAYYFSQLEGPERGPRHRKCSLDECFGHNINPDTHRIRHVHASCTCPMVDAEMDAIANILEQPDLIPVMVFEKGTDLQIRVVPHTEVTSYMTISYVASQIFASPMSNALPRCQMLALRHVVRICSESLVKAGEVCGVWIDTLHVPVEGVRRMSREQALMKMQMTFEKATVVLVVDPYLATRASTSFQPAEFAAYFVCSPWFTRLWTFSESQLATSLWIWYAGRPLSIDQFLKDQDWPNSSRGWRTYDTIETIGRLRRMNRSLVHDDEDKIYRRQGHEYLDIITQMLQHRQTSQPSDEPFCLSMLMHLDTTAILRAPKESRMEALYRQLTNVTAVLLIQSGERLTSPGYRWAPKTLLGRKAVYRYSHDHDYTIRRDGWGIRVPWPYFAYKLTVVTNADGQGCPDDFMTRRILFRVPTKDMFGQRSTSTGREATVENSVDEGDSYRLASFTTTTNVFQPIQGTKKPFPVPGNQFVVMFRGWGRDGSKGPSVLLELEDDDSELVKQAGQEPRDTGNPRIFTRYGRGGAFTQRSREQTERKEAKHLVEAAFAGHDPWNSERVVCESEKIPMLNTDVWVS